MPKEELIQISLELPHEVVDWIDAINAQLGLRSRGATVARLIQELHSEAVNEDA